MDRLRAARARRPDPRAGSPPTGRSSASASGLQLLFEGSDEDGAATLGVLPGRTAPARGRPDAPPHRLEPGRAAARPPAVRRDPRRRPTSTSSTRTPASPAGPDADDVVLADDDPRRGRSSARSPADHVLGVQFHPERSGARRAAAARQRRRARRVPARRTVAARPPVAAVSRLMLRRRVIPCLDVANGRVVKGTRFVDLVDEGDPPELAERYAARGRRRARLPRHHGRARGPRHAPRHRRADRPPGVHPADGRRRRPERRRHARRAPGRRRQGLAEHGRGRGSRR